ncbi:beta-ketoacyl-ACP synthase III (plasmid) [Pontibacillus sp. ALD_SL1]|uniref:beta-ketoacyl-ACP synthase III n=1 Tax=Pontibacillus sp. ALD_SL1 TaxID=2777185 RepID=UPI001A95C87C|nr:beta-ketoacyl-ACP synthase III [Pontibacillus sp. ALD_SL1]QST02100.1 beta-ketoacyl-ACP synthase III [Pontibacillus sp. ALD_SL1]
MRKVQILGMGKYLPPTIVTAEETDAVLGVSKGWSRKKSGVQTRYFARGETASEMAAKAIFNALEKASLALDEVGAIVSVSGTMEQAIPCNAALIHEQLKPRRPIPAFDLNATCLSFVTGMDVVSHLIHNGAYRNVLLVSSEIASVGINPKQKESYPLFGDGAVACILSLANESDQGVVASHMETYSEGARYTEIRGGGTRLHPNVHKKEEDFLFDMRGKEVFRLSSKVIDGFVSELLEKASLRMEELTLVVPHQASGMAMRIMRKKLGVKEEQFMNVIEKYGNMIAASIPLALHDAIEEERIQRGDAVLLLGTSAGLSVGGVLLVY